MNPLNELTVYVRGLEAEVEELKRILAEKQTFRYARVCTRCGVLKLAVQFTQFGTVCLPCKKKGTTDRIAARKAYENAKYIERKGENK